MSGLKRQTTRSLGELINRSNEGVFNSVSKVIRILHFTGDEMSW